MQLTVRAPNPLRGPARHIHETAVVPAAGSPDKHQALGSAASRAAPIRQEQGRPDALVRAAKNTVGAGAGDPARSSSKGTIGEEPPHLPRGTCGPGPGSATVRVGFGGTLP